MDHGIDAGPHREPEIQKPKQDTQSCELAAEIAARKRLELALRESQASLRISQELAHVGSWTWDTASGRVEWSDEMFRIFGVEPEGFCDDLDEIIRRTIHPDDRERVFAINSAMIQGQVPSGTEYRLVWPDGAVRMVWTQAGAQMRDPSGKLLRLTGIVQDITERKRAEEALQRMLHGKEVLLQEVHHRVKNNMQVISSLLSLQGQTLSEPAAIEGLADLRDRIRSMSLIQERLYCTENFVDLDFVSYLRELSSELLTTHRSTSTRVSLEVAACASLLLPIDQAVPCGLIVAELVINCLKHAFTGRPDGTVRIRADADATGEVTIGVEDDGVGLPANLDLSSAGTLGLRLVGMLVHQLRGSLRVEPGEGARLRITFHKAMPGEPMP